MRTWIAKSLLAIIAFFLLWVVLFIFAERLLDAKAIIEWLQGKNWLSFAKPEVRDFLLQQGWQFLLAAIVTLLLFRRSPVFLQDAVTFLEGRLFQPRFLFLPKPHPDWLDFRARALPLVGRDHELDEFNRFLHQEKKFLWWWVNGEGGSGKSRLVLEWMFSLPKFSPLFFPYGYDSGFLRGEVSDDFWRKWHPRRPTLIVVDNTAEHEANLILVLLAILGEREPKLRHPVRVLLMERAIPGHLDKLERETRYYDHRYRSTPLTILPLGSEHLQCLALALAAKRKKPLNLTQQEESQVLKVSGGLPLLIVLTLDSLMEYGYLRWDTREEFLQEQTLRLRAKFQKHGLEEHCMPLLALATFTYGLPWEVAKHFQPDATCHNKILLDRLFQQDTSSAIPPIQPDLLGEYFLLEEFAKLTAPQREDFLKIAWEVSPRGVAFSLSLT